MMLPAADIYTYSKKKYAANFFVTTSITDQFSKLLH